MKQRNNILFKSIFYFQSIDKFIDGRQKDF